MTCRERLIIPGLLEGLLTVWAVHFQIHKRGSGGAALHRHVNRDGTAGRGGGGRGADAAGIAGCRGGVRHQHGNNTEGENE
ncbi:hypothetical protein SE17_35135 [Kouleothrix aurantiaca]|uniref:Uncharacterized protein n=1 Tax=Kouleothrix aurantiaca TaxID=186479 RepID=A0A0P9D0M3_9CHLR|nr:hypothetical protein SE17_35135 [Kouleothrix aurantiaca]